MKFPKDFPRHAELRKRFRRHNEVKASEIAAYIVAKKAYPGEHNAGMFPTKDGKYFFSYEIDGYCYGHLVRNSIVGTWFFDRSFRSTRQSRHGPLDPTIRDEYFDWLANTSPWKDAVLFKDNLYKDGIWLNTEKNGAYLFQALVLFRYSLEKPRIVSNWKKYKDWGLSPMEALIAAHYYHYNDHRKSLDDANVIDNHTILSHRLCKNYAKALLGGHLADRLPFREVNGMTPSSFAWEYKMSRSHVRKIATGGELVATRWGYYYGTPDGGHPITLLKDWIRGIRNA